ncbi:lipocalin family protein [Xanthomonas citri pv. citri]
MGLLEHGDDLAIGKAGLLHGTSSGKGTRKFHFWRLLIGGGITLRPDGRIQTTFTFRKGSFQAPLKSMHPIGQVAKQGNGALWRMQFFWPFKAEYVIAWLDAGYTQTIVARSKRDYVWYMARTPQVSDTDYQQAVQRIAAMGYDVSQLRRVPQSAR